jgi:hypothetical protein
MKMHQPRDSDSRRVTLDRWELRRAGESLEGFDADHRGDVRGLEVSLHSLAEPCVPKTPLGRVGGQAPEFPCHHENQPQD